ncbi:ROK family transcriptional regulator [Rhizocola hellebori]|uniref:ROK family transcriptional regulator n=1 Tax=Rhizocola hellebori TaxID=1392758 RepID=UPI001942076C|nr:ROK family transcriptional regulator [Rhizocola hellebori]
MPARDLPVRQTSLRAHNLALVLRLVAASPTPISRARIAGASGLTRATVSTIVDELIAGGLVDFADESRTGVGRPSVGVTLAGTRPAGLGMEVNVDYLATCVIDLAGQVRHREVVLSDQRGRSPAAAWEALAAPAARALAAAAAQGLVVHSGAVALPGLIEDAVVHVAPNLGWHRVALPARIGDLLVDFGNEANLAAFGELHACELSSFLYVSGEIGIGAGIVVNSELFRGTRGWAGELGHVTVDPAGKPCRCGSRGCLEQYAGEDAIREAASLPDAAELVDRAKAGDEATLASLGRAGLALGVALSSTVNLLDLPAVVLGGHFAPLAEWLCPPIEAELRQRVLTARWSSPLIRPSVLGAEATVIGAARTVTQAIINDPARYLASIRP